MDIDVFIKSLSGLDGLLKRSSLKLMGTSLNPQIKSVKKGCLILEVAVSLSQNPIDLLNSDGINAALNFMGILALGSSPFIFIFKKIKNRKIIKIEKIGLCYRALLEDGEYIEGLNESTVILLKDHLIRHYLKDFVSPLKEHGIDTIEFSKDNINYNKSIYKGDIIFYDNLIDKKVVSEIESEFRFKIQTLSFNENKKWLMFDLNSKQQIHVTIEDDDLYLDIEERYKSFGKHDILVCDVNVIESIEKDGRYTYQHIIKNVKKHIVALEESSIQMEMPF